jgi:hypothetical protein
VPIQLVALTDGIRAPLYQIYAVGEDENFPVVTYLETLKQSNADSYQRLMAMIDRYAQHGPPTNDFRKSRYIDKNEKILEFKTKDGNRITWFYDAGRMIICINGFPKPNKKRLRQDTRVAVAWKKKYEAARDQHQVCILPCIP